MAAIGAAFMALSIGLVGIGGAIAVFTLASLGIAMYFTWFDQHIGAFIKRGMTSLLGGSALLGGSGALGLWLGSLFGLAAPIIGGGGGVP